MQYADQARHYLEKTAATADIDLSLMSGQSF